MKIYLAGPMRGVPYFNHPAFHAAAKQLRSEGHEVFSPAEYDNEKHGQNSTGCEETATREHGFDRRAAMKSGLVWICDHADAIAMLPNWEKSSGARAEYALAYALSLQFITL